MKMIFRFVITISLIIYLNVILKYPFPVDKITKFIPIKNSDALLVKYTDKWVICDKS